MGAREVGEIASSSNAKRGAIRGAITKAARVAGWIGRMLAVAIAMFLSGPASAVQLVQFRPDLIVVEPRWFWAGSQVAPGTEGNYVTPAARAEAIVEYLRSGTGPCAQHTSLDRIEPATGYIPINGREDVAYNFWIKTRPAVWHFSDFLGCGYEAVSTHPALISLHWECPEGFNGVAQHYDAAGNIAYYAADRAALWVACVASMPQPPDDKTCRGNPILCGTGVKTQTESDLPATPAGTLGFSRRYHSNDGAWLLDAEPHGADLRVANPAPKLCYPGVSKTYGIADCFKWWTHYDTPVFALRRSNGRMWYFSGSDLAAAFKDSKDTVRQSTNGQGDTVFDVSTQDNYLERYLPSGQLTERVRADGVAEFFTYSDATTPPEVAPHPGLLIAITDSFGRQTTLTYTAEGDLAQARGPDGQIAQYQVSGGVVTSVTYPDGSTRSYIYDEPGLGATGGHGLLTGIVDENGDRFATYGYDSSKRAILSEHAGGVSRYSLTYPGTYQTQGVDALGSTETFNFRNGGVGVAYKKQLSSLSQTCESCAGGTRSMAYTYDANGNVASRTDFNGNKTTYTYDLTRNLETQRVEASGTARARTITTRWHPDWRLESGRAEPGRLTTWVYNGRPDPDAGNVITWCAPASALLPDGKPIAVLCKKIEQSTTDTNGSQGFAATASGDLRTWSYTYNQLGQVLTATNPRGASTAYTYHMGTTADHSLGDLWKVTNALGHVTEYTRFDPMGRPLEIRDPNGLITSLAYNARGWLVRRAVGPEATDYVYDAAGLLTRISLSDGDSLRHAYDAAHRLTTVSDSQGNRIVYTLDAAGNRTREDIYDPLGQLVRTRARVFDTLNRLRLDIGALGQATNYSHDANDNMTGTTDPIGRITSQAYDALDRLIQVTDPMGGQTAYAYDGQDRLSQVTDPKHLATGYTRNGFGDVTHTDSPDTGLATTEYDAAGNPVRHTDARGQTATTTYDALNRVTRVDYGDGSRLYHWDACPNGLGRLCALTDPAGETRYDYDLRGRVTRKTWTVDGRSLSVAYAYDPAGRLAALTLPSGKTLAYTWTGHRIAGLAIDGQPVLSGAGYEPFGPVHGWTWGNGQSHFRAYDLDGRPFQIDGLPSLPTDLTWDIADRITAIQDGPRLPDNFGYDALDRLTQADGDWGSQGFDYDPVGNRTLKTDGATSTQYLYGAADHHLTSEIGPISRNYQYDAAGNLIHDGTFAYVYDDAGRLVEVTQGGTTAALYRHNALGQRVRKTTAAGTTDFVYDEAGHLIGEYDTQGQARREYLWFDDLPVAVLARSGPGATTEQVLDNTGATYVGTWPTSTSVAGYLGANYQTHVANGAPVGAITVDNGQAIYTGAWPTSTAVAGFEGVNYQTRAPNGPPPAALIQDNTQAAYVGTWPVSTSVGGYQGTNYQTHAAGTGQNAATWSFNLATPGPYEVHARWTAHANRASNAQYAIAHADGTATATVNQRLNGGQWNNLGTFNFATAASVTLTDQADGYVIADAIMLVPVGAGPNSATWTLPVATPGEYEVQAKWTAHPNRATNAQYTIGYANGTATMTANQQTNGGIWNSLGTYRFNDSATVKLTDQADGYVIADAIRLVPVGAPPNSATWSFDLGTPGVYEVQARWMAHPNRASNARYAIAYAGGTTEVTVDQRQNNGTWNSLGSYVFGTTATVQLTDQADGYVIADAIKLIHTAPATAGLYYVHADHLGTPRKISRPNDNQVIWSWNGAPFGETPANEDPDGDGTRFEFNPRFPGQYFDAETGKHYNYFRDYDPGLGRYIQSDPIGLDGGINTYGYVENNPLNDIDLMGLMGGGAGQFPGRGQGPFGPVCGTEGAAAAHWVPDLSVKACKKHDDCYDRCARVCGGLACKLQCDGELAGALPLYGLATALRGGSTYDSLLKKYGCDKCTR